MIISHDDKYFDLADRIIKLDYGQVIIDQKLALVPADPALQL